MKINILYKDKDLVICLKPAGVLSESSGMPELIKAELGGEVYCVHRLDRAVGGVMVYARSKRAAAALSRLIAQREFKKEYLALIPDKLAEDEAVLEDLLFKDSSKNKSYVVKRPRNGVKEAKLSYRCLSRRNGRALLAIELNTGRFHQIRCQLASRGAPLLGDVKYGSERKDCPLALFAYALSFRHPISGEQLHFSALPAGTPWDETELPLP